MFLTGLGALLIICGLLYMLRATIWRGPLSGRDSSRQVRGTLEPPRRGLGIPWDRIELAGNRSDGRRCLADGVRRDLLGPELLRP
jgi:hypothetical protein